MKNDKNTKKDYEILLRRLCLIFLVFYTIIILGFFLILLPKNLPLFPYEIYFFSPIILFTMVRGVLFSTYSTKDLALTSINIIANIIINILFYFKSVNNLNLLYENQLTEFQKENFQLLVKLSPFVYSGFIDFLANIFMWLALITFVFLMIKKHKNFQIENKIYINSFTKPFFYVFVCLFIFFSSVILFKIFEGLEIEFVIYAQIGKNLLQILTSLIYVIIFIYTETKSFLYYAITPLSNNS